MIHGINHVGISVRNIGASMRFYCEMMHMEVVVPPTSFGGELYERILALKGARGSAALLRRGSLQLELFEFEQPAPASRDPRYPVSDHGISHFCIDVSDIEVEYERLKASGVAFHCRPLDFGTAKATYGRDPDGNVFELLQKRAAPTSAKGS